MSFIQTVVSNTVKSANMHWKKTHLPSLPAPLPRRQKRKRQRPFAHEMCFIIWYIEHETCVLLSGTSNTKHAVTFNSYIMAFIFCKSNVFCLIMRYLFYYLLICNGSGPTFADLTVLPTVVWMRDITEAEP